MARYCYHCGNKVRLADQNCPYCAAEQPRPGDPFIGFLWNQSFYVLVALVFIILPILLCTMSYYFNLKHPYWP